MNDTKQINRITRWFAFVPGVGTSIDEGTLTSSWNQLFLKKQNEYLKQFTETLFDKINEIANGTEWGVAFGQIEETTPSFEVKIYLEHIKFLNEIIKTIKNSNKDIVFYCHLDGRFSDFINMKYDKDPPQKHDD